MLVNVSSSQNVSIRRVIVLSKARPSILFSDVVEHGVSAPKQGFSEAGVVLEFDYFNVYSSTLIITPTNKKRIYF